jgi:ATP-binding protein involved in chromosome partitioning
MSNLTDADIRQALDSLTPEGETQSLVASDRVQGIVVKGGNIGFSIEVDGLSVEAVAAVKEQAEVAVRALSGEVSVTCVLTAHKAPSVNTSGDTNTKPANQGPHNSASTEMPKVFERVGAVIAVASGKGGVGKSTVAVNLAISMAKQGKRVGLLDADIYGPSAPQLLNIANKPDLNDEKKLIPIERHGVFTMSIGYMVSPEQAMIWRGPMVQSALIQMLDDVAWPELDVLIIDMPPGTGDIQLTMAQRIPVTGALLVTTPSSLATADVKRAIVMFEKTEIPVFGLVENMAYMSAPDGTKLFPFGQGGHELADKLGLKHLAALPLEAAVQAASESGLPLSAAQNSAAETSETAQAFTNLAAALVRQI